MTRFIMNLAIFQLKMTIGAEHKYRQVSKFPNIIKPLSHTWILSKCL